jgi:hypothetical protein
MKLFLVDGGGAGLGIRLEKELFETCCCPKLKKELLAVWFGS